MTVVALIVFTALDALFGAARHKAVADGIERVPAVRQAPAPAARE